MNLDWTAPEQVPRVRIPEVLGVLEKTRATLWARLVSPESPAAKGDPGRLNHDKLLTADEVSERLGMSKRWVYRHRKKLGGKKLGINVRFTESGLKRYLGGLR